MTCHDCIHIDVCFGVKEVGIRGEYAELCKRFKNKADFVEVVRCSQCKYKDTDAFNRTVCKRDFNIVEIKDTHFCSYGEKNNKE